MDNIKINKLEIENVKRVKAVKIEPTANGLTVIGGGNNQGKTSVLDAIAWALGGDSYRPSEAWREGSTIPPQLHLVLSNGIVVERKGKNSSLKVIDPSGQKGGQQLLNSFVEQLAINLPGFMEASGKEKAQTLLKIIGVGDKLSVLERQEQELYNKRLVIGQIADQKKKFAREMKYFPDAPKELISASELIIQQQEILVMNGENQKKRKNLENIKKHVTDLNHQIDELQKKLETAAADLEAAQKSAVDLHDQSTAELERNITKIEDTNREVRCNLDKDKAEEDAADYESQYMSLTTEIAEIRQSKIDLLKGTDLPLPGLDVQEGELIYNDHKWDSISGSDQLKVATAIVRKLKPSCGFVLLDKLEQMDLKTLKDFGDWLEHEGLQAIATRVSTGNECSIIIEDGYVAGTDHVLEEPKKNQWKAGEF